MVIMNIHDYNSKMNYFFPTRIREINATRSPKTYKTSPQPSTTPLLTKTMKSSLLLKISLLLEFTVFQKYTKTVFLFALIALTPLLIP
jgi:hypothetical protein